MERKRISDGAVRPGSIDIKQEEPEKFPFDAFAFDGPEEESPVLELKAPWRWTAAVGVIDVSANRTLTEEDAATIYLVSGATMVTLPAVGEVIGRIYWFVKADNTVHQVTITPANTETIEGSGAIVLSLQFDKVSLTSGGTTWLLLS